MKPYYYFVCFSAVTKTTGGQVLGQRLMKTNFIIRTPDDFDKFYEYLVDVVISSDSGLDKRIIITNFFLLDRSDDETAN